MSNREKQLIGLVVALLTILVMYYALYRPMMNRKEDLEDDIATLTSEVDILRSEYLKMPEYKEGIVIANNLIDEIEGDYPAGLVQESGFKLIFDIEETFENILFSDMSFGQIETISYSDDASSGRLKGLRQVLGSNLTLSYDDLKSFLDYINKYDDRTVLTGLNLNLSEEDSRINATITMNMYAIEGNDREFFVPEFEEVPAGKDMIFDSPALQTKREESSYVRPSDDAGDIFVSLKPTAADIEAQIIGVEGAGAEDTYVKQDFNDQAYALLRLYIVEGQYYVNYDIEGKYKESIAFSKGTTLEMDVYSADRLDDNDRAGMTLTIINQTGETLYVNIKEEDVNNPRLTTNVTEGRVVVE